MSDGGRGDETARRAWAECERQLFLAGMPDPAIYGQIIEAVRALADALRSAATLEGLLALWPRADEIFSSVTPAGGVVMSGPTRRHIAGAAFAMREREIRRLAHGQAIRGRLAAARETGAPWVVLDEAGQLDAGLINPYRSVEMHMGSGYAVVSEVRPDPDRGVAAFAVFVVKLDASTGELLDAEPGVETPTEFARREDFEAHRDAVRVRVASLG